MEDRHGVNRSANLCETRKQVVRTSSEAGAVQHTWTSNVVNPTIAAAILLKNAK
jgi:hypothetical protein